MGRHSIADLRARGVPQADIDAAREMQQAQRQAGAPVQPISVLVGVTQPRQQPKQNQKNQKNTVDFTDQALRRRSRYDQAALLLDQQAMAEKSPERRALARDAAKSAKELSKSQQLEFDFFGGGNVSIAFQFQDAITQRLFDKAKTPAKAKEAMSILWTICRHLAWQSYECSKNAAELCEITHTKPSDMSVALKLLETVGAIRRIKRGRSKIITVTPEGAFRGNINTHAESVERYRLEVIDGGKPRQTDLEEFTDDQ